MDSGVVDRGVEFVNSFGSALFSVAYQTIDSLDPSPNVTCLNYLRLPWVSQKGSDVALESDDPRCCIFSRSAKDCLASRSCPAPSRLCYLLVSSALCSPWFSPEKAYPQWCMQSLFRYVCSSPLRHSHRVPAPILILSSVQPCAARAARVVFDSLKDDEKYYVIDYRMRLQPPGQRLLSQSRADNLSHVMQIAIAG